MLDKSRFRIVNKGRQIGFSTAIAFECVRDAIAGHNSLIVSASEKNAQEVLRKCRLWVDGANQVGCGIGLDTDSKSELTLSTGGKVLSLSQNPRTVRGFTGSVYLDEFAYHQNDREIYEAILPAATLGYRISLVSTPLGESGLFHSVWSGQNGRYADFSRHRVTIDDAITAGLSIDRAAIERNLDADAFRQEYLCEFIDEASAYLPYELLRRGIGDYQVCREHYLGVDIGRRRDITSICVVGELNGKFYVKHIEDLDRQTFGAQRLAIKSQYAEHKASRACVDATGLGMQLAEELQEEILAEPVVFTNESKERMIVRVKRLLEAGRLIIPDNPKLIADLHSIRKEVTASNNVRFDAARTGEGHADRAWSLALAVEAATKPIPVVEIY